jgi:bifunctional DNA-binding transcriptional regulator/antitoxin component of YhaV-PrlF toxin-antitoxin module
MEDLNILRKVDNVGRIKIPQILINKTFIGPGDSVEYFIKGNLIIIRKFNSK